ncbi:MAG: tRNA threonylcarbamoyladenosine dehydratase [Polyangiaceae bacterium]|nr:tRNA threonylcarbamoyladenosine dehydratase [Polyangiaceae bacterium]
MSGSTRNRFERCERLLGRAAIRALGEASVAVFGLGGVGSFCAEALARSGVGRLRLVDHDVVALTDVNRHPCASEDTIGVSKAELLSRRLRCIWPEGEFVAVREFFDREKADELLVPPVSYVVDAIDSIGPKVELVAQCLRRGLGVVTVVGSAGRLDPTLVRVGCLTKVRSDPLAQRLRKMLRRQGIHPAVTAVYSEEPRTEAVPGAWPRMTDSLFRGRQRMIQPSMVMVPAAAGMAAASVCIRAIAGTTGPADAS